MYFLYSSVFFVYIFFGSFNLVTCVCSCWTSCSSYDGVQCQRANTESWTCGEKFLKNYAFFLLESCCNFWVSSMMKEEEMWITFHSFQPLLHLQKQKKQTPLLLCCNKGQTVWPQRSTSVGGIDCLIYAMQELMSRRLEKWTEDWSGKLESPATGKVWKQGFLPTTKNTAGMPFSNALHLQLLLKGLQ